MGFDFTELESMLSTMFQDLLGGPELVGIVALLFFVLFAVFLRLPLSIALVVLIPFSILLGVAGYLPVWLIFFIALGCGLVLYLTWRRLMDA